MNPTLRAALVAAAAAPPLVASAGLITFDSLSPGPSGVDNGSSLHGGFTDGGAFFQNVFTDFGGGFTSWSGFALSNVNAPSTPGFGNQYAVYGDGSGRGGAGNYLVLFDNNEDDRVNLGPGQSVLGLHVNNTAYAALSMRDGDPFAKKFGGVSGSDPDFFRLTILGRDAGGGATGSVDVHLADYRSADPAGDVILAQWTYVDLSALAPATRSLHFSFASSDNGAFGMNTPAYVAIDDVVVVPEPSAGALLLAGLVWLRRRGRGPRIP